MVYVKVVQCKQEEFPDAVQILPNPVWRFDFINDLIKIKSALTFPLRLDVHFTLFFKSACS